MALKRFLEIDHRGFAFHEPSPISPFSTGASVPPKEVLFCDCEGVGLSCHHVYEGDVHVGVYGPSVETQHQDEWKKEHSDSECQHRRQIFVDVTNRPDAKLGMFYDEATDTFSKERKVAA